MKALIKDVKFNKEYESKFGTLYSHKVWYDDKMGFYSSKKKDQNKFIKGKEAEFTEETRQTSQGEMLIIKPVTQNRNSNFGRALKREQSKYSGFALAYAKDLVVAGKIEAKQMFPTADKMFTWMFEKDKSIEA